MRNRVLHRKPVRYFVTGGAGFIGSHLVDKLIETGEVTVYDNLNSGKREFIQHHIGKSNFHFIQADLLDFNNLKKAIANHDMIFHLAANPDVRAGITNTNLDLQQGTLATYNVLEAMRLNLVDCARDLGPIAALDDRADADLLFR